MATRQTIREEVERRLGDTANAIWTDAELNGLIDQCIGGLYPLYFRYDQSTTTAGTGPTQPLPAGAKNIYAVDIQLAGSARTRAVLEWSEGATTAVLPVSGITGATLIWSWTKGFTVPAADGTTLDLSPEAEKYVVVNTHLSAMEKLLSSRTHLENYRILQTIREGVSAQDITTLVNDLRVSLESLAARAIPRPEPRRRAL